MDDEPAARRLSARELSVAAPLAQPELEQLIQLGMLRPGPDGRFAIHDIQRVRAVMAMLSPGITLEQLLPAFTAGYFTLEPIEMFFPRPAAATDQSFAELAGELGLPYEMLARLVIASGFPAPRPDDFVREDDGLLLRQLVLAGELFGGKELTFRAARILGEATRRAADAGLALFEEGDEMRSIDHREAMLDPQARDEMNERGGRLMRLSEELLARMYRRHLEHALSRLWANSAEQFLDQMGIRPAANTPPGLAFVDLVGYSSLTESAGDATAARLAGRLAELAEDVAAGHAGRVVKLLGDGAMMHFVEPLAAARGALELVSLMGRSQLPPARGGVHAGPLIERDGDFFGRTVNLAARIAQQATPGQVLVSAEVATVGGRVAGAAQLRFSSVGERLLKGIGNHELFEALPARG